MKQFLALCAGLVLSTGVLAQIDSSFAAILQSEIDSRRTAAGITGIEFTIILDGGCRWTTTSGLGASGNPIDTSLYFTIGSVSKSMTASLILLLQEDGLLDIDDPIGMHIDTDELLYVDSTETIRQLLNHTSTISNNWGDNPTTPLWQAVWADRDSVWSWRDALDSVYMLPKVSNPNRNHNYNAFTTYSILGMIIEEVSGNTYEQEAQTRLFTPLGMSNSVIFTNGLSMSQLNGVYANGQDRSTWSHTSYLTTRGGGGSWAGNSSDAATFIRALHTGQVISASNLADMHTKVDNAPVVLPGTCNGTVEVNYGLGTNIWEFRGADTSIYYGHGGNGLGMNILMHSADYGYTMAILGNDFEKVNEVGLMSIELGCVIENALSSYSCSIGSEEWEQSFFMAYPNPGSDVLNVNWGTDIQNGEVLILSNSGETVYSSTVHGIRTEINTAGLPMGVYIIQLNDGKHIRTSRWIKAE